MNKPTKAIILIVGALLVIPPYIAGMIVLFGGHLNSDQANTVGTFVFVGFVYWFFACLALAIAGDFDS